MPGFSELTAVTLAEIWPRVLRDNFFRAAPFISYIRRHMLKTYQGGAFMQTPGQYAPLIGGSYAQGDTFNLAKPQTLDAMAFDPKYYYVNDTEYLEEIATQATGPMNIVNLVEAHLNNAMQTLTAILDIAIWRHGQASGSNISDNRVTQINGLSEALNNGTDNSWDGNVFATYGTKTRGSGVVGTGLNSTPIWFGDASGNAGTFTYNGLLEMYTFAGQRGVFPDLGVSNAAIWNFMLERVQPQQRFEKMSAGTDQWGARSLQLMDCNFLIDPYAPSAVYGVNDPNLGNYLTSTFTSATSPTAASKLPGATTVTVGEVIALLNTKQWAFRPTANTLFNFGFTGFKVAQNSTMVAGQTLFGGNVENFSPWGSIQGYGINS